ncbi:class I SAM-dependent methyltransferase [Phyllobacterium sp. OV277]|uniref:class I SAM-dependent methyltransferase n=1 Tax=Phyllobacterium sp. OV277 TaxID=1882772 RepID=UPI00088E0D92|nr:class I SAM-dependent methyltransferase [Phyllobacterium sp. OV277]SDP63292.1 Methyltransferase domain-containing protein [Phyllobacterium sp. OV277]
MKKKSLRELFDQHHGFGSDKWLSYFEIYQKQFESLREKEINLLEIGIQNGGSLEIWAQFFPKAHRILGCDIDAACAKLQFADQRIDVVIGDASDLKTSQKITEKLGEPDIIIDDGSHRVEDVIRSFALYFPKLSPGGLYVIEDLHSSYWPDFGGGSDLQLSSMGFLKLLTDLLSKDFWKEPSEDFDYLKPYADRYGVYLPESQFEIAEMSFANSICVIRKADRSVLNERLVSGKIFEVVGRIETIASQDKSDGKLVVSHEQLKQATDIQKEFIETSSKALELKSENVKIRQEIVEIAAEVGQLQSENTQLNSENTELSSQMVYRATELEAVHQELAEQQAALDAREADIQAKELQIEQLSTRVSQLLSSTSWAITKPLRILSSMLKSIWPN